MPEPCAKGEAVPKQVLLCLYMLLTRVPAVEEEQYKDVQVIATATRCSDAVRIARKVLVWPKRDLCKLAHAFRWEYSYSCVRG